MRKLTPALFALSLISTSCFAQDMSFGVNYFNSSNSFEAEFEDISADVDDDSNGIELVLGFINPNRLTTYVEYQNENFDDGVYDDNNDPLHSVSVGLIKEFIDSGSFHPYLQGSLGLGYMSIDDRFYTDDSAYSFGANIGAGLAYYPVNNARVHLGVDGQYRSWSSIETDVGDIDISDTSLLVGLGLTYLF